MSSNKTQKYLVHAKTASTVEGVSVANREDPFPVSMGFTLYQDSNNATPMAAVITIT